MKIFTKKSVIQKIIFVIVLLLLVNFTVAPYASYAISLEEIGGSLAKEIMQFLAFLGDVVMGALNNFMLGADGVGSAMLSKDDLNIGNSDSWLYPDSNGEVVSINSGEIDTAFLTGSGESKYEIPNMLYSPENIFANNIAVLDVNFLRPNEYNSIYVSGGSGEFKNNADEAAKSAAGGELRKTIASWYKSFRNIAVVGLLSVLIYIGIRILISSTAADKAKYKESLKDWLVALCLVFTIHFIMSAILMVTDKCNELFATKINQGYTVRIDDKEFKTNITGLVRFKAQSSDGSTATAYTIIYLALVIYTCMFTFMYFKRFLYMAFFTMISPLVALTYPIDRAGDGKSQAFNMWFKEYTMNVIIQPVHLILYTVFVSSAYSLAAKNPIYALVAIGFLIPAEKFIKRMFGLDKADSTSGFGSFAGGALAMSGLQKLAQLGSGGKGNKGKSNGTGADNSPDKGIFMADKRDGLDSFKNEENNDDNVRQQMPDTDDNDDDRQRMLNADNENFGTEDWDSQQADALARELSADDGGMQYSDDEYRQILMDSGYGEDEINQIMGEENPQQQAGTDTSTSALENNGPRRTITGAIGGIAKRGAKSAAHQIWKNKGKIARGAIKAGGAVAGATVGLAAGLTTGDFSKTAQYVGAGAIAGNALGGTAANLGVNVGRGITQTGRNARTVFEQEMYGYNEARKMETQRQNKKAKKEFMNDDKEIAKYSELKAKLNYDGDVKELMEAAADYKKAGITDDKLIQNSLKAEYKRDGKIKGNSHDNFVDVASFSYENGYGKDYIEDDKKRTALEGIVSKNTEISDPKAQREVVQTLAEIYGRGDYYRSVGKLGKK